MKRIKMNMWVIGLITFIIISNIPPIESLFTLFIDDTHYRFSNGDGGFTGTDIEFKNRHYNLSPVVPSKYRQLNPNSIDTIVYRIFWKNPLTFWRWRKYFYDKRYKLPYKSWKEIKKRRGYVLKYSNNLQDF